MTPTKSILVRRAAFFALAALVTSCGNKSGTIEPEAKPTASAGGVEAPKPTANADAPKPTASADAPVAPLPVRMAEGKLALNVFTKAPYRKFRVFPVGGRMVIAPDMLLVSGGSIQEKSDFADLELKGEDKSGSEEAKPLSDLTLLNVMGSYPDDLWLDIEGAWGFVIARSNAGTYTERRYTYLRQFGKFGRVPDMPLGAWPWSKKRTLAYLGDGKFRLALNNRKNPDPLPKQAAGKDRPVRVNGAAMMALPSGKVAVLGTDGDAQGALALEMWGEASDEESLSKSQIVALPGAPSGKPLGAWVALHGDVAYVAADHESGAYLAEVRGGRATPIAPPEAHLGGVHVAADGTLFVAGQSAVYRYDGAADGAARFTPAALPASVKVKSQQGLFAESRDHVYWAVSQESGSMILSTYPAPPAPAASAKASASASAGPAPGDSGNAAPSASASGNAAPSASASGNAAPSASASGNAAPVVSASGNAAPAASASGNAAPAGATASVAAAALLDAFPALTDTCATPVVVLFPVAKSTPRDFDFAATKTELKDYPGAADLKLVEVEQGGERFLVAVVKDAKAASLLVAYLTGKNKDAAPKAACYAVPSSAREVH